MTLQQDIEKNEAKYLHKLTEFANQRVLEIGCGEGRLTWQYAKETNATIAIDLDADALRVATIDRPSDLERKAHFSLAKSERIPFPNESFDTAIFAWSF
jgi:ubiquinone/menaquinone biosynthesis C-methylase UbiE